MINSTSTQVFEIQELLQAIFTGGFEGDDSFAIWRKPKSNALELIYSPKEEIQKVNLEIESLPPGFIIHPFADQKNQEAFFIEAEHYHRFDLSQPLELSDMPNFLRELIEHQNQDAVPFQIFKSNSSASKNFESAYSEEQSHFEGLVNEVKEGIQKGLFEKVVPARTKTIPLNSDFDLVKSFEALLRKYPNAFVNFFHLPKIGTWLGASPEVLIETKEDQFYTMSLAGTQPANGDNPIKSVAWTQKEIEEQALVSRYIVDCFKKIRLREYEEHGPKTVQAGTLLHLRSDFKVNMKETNFPQLGSVMLKLLHPTSAVCGMPRQPALDFIREKEGFDREFFAGFLGPININQVSSIYVNLRTASLKSDRAIVFAGAGVTEDSDPTLEWEETELKCANIGRILQNPDQ
ncbi:chorismate-binding protein [Algoriphagus namhaensis]|uniref:isochorismate synthase n=1 Tax=Algoriphagus namhaensis TaxID=915353 RepID=A0ABV8ASQ3_9BACT